MPEDIIQQIESNKKDIN